MEEKTLKESLAGIPDGHCLILSSPIIEMMMSGVCDARIRKDGLIKLVYEDGMIETGNASKEILEKTADEQALFSWVECVQSQR